MAKILGIDYGRKRLGLAICGSLRIASPLSVVERTSPEKDFAVLARLSEEQGVERIVLGLPKNMDGSMGEMAQEVRKFAEELESRCELPVVLWDERLTSWQAERSMIEAGLSSGKRKKKLDSVAAALILQNYIDFDSSPPFS